MNLKGTKKKKQVITTNIIEQQELLKKAEVIRKNLKASIWHKLEINGKFYTKKEQDSLYFEHFMKVVYNGIWEMVRLWIKLRKLKFLYA